MQGQYACVMIAHEDVEDDAHWIRWLRHAAQVNSHLLDTAKAPYMSHVLSHAVTHICVMVHSYSV